MADNHRTRSVQESLAHMNAFEMKRTVASPSMPPRSGGTAASPSAIQRSGGTAASPSTIPRSGGTAASPSTQGREAAAPPRHSTPETGGTAASPSTQGREAAVPPLQMVDPERGRDGGPAVRNPTLGRDGGPAVPRYSSRRHPTHLPNIERFNQPVILFLTVCSNERRPVLACERVHEALKKVWPQALQYCVGRYIVMPDHLHLFCAPTVRDPENVSRWAAYWKRLASRELNELTPLWQRDCWDTQLRQSESYADKWAYVRNNPVRSGLVSHADDWPYQGCLNELRW